MLDDPRGFVLFYLGIWICILFVRMMRKYWKEVYFLFIYTIYVFWRFGLLFKGFFKLYNILVYHN